MRKILVVVDMQKDFIDGALGFDGADKIIPGIIAKIKAFEEAGDEIVYTLDTHFENYMDTQEGKNLPVPHCIKGSDGWGLCDELKPILEGIKSYEKPCFGSMELAKYLEQNSKDITTIEVCGLVSNICVLSNAVLAKAAAPEAEVIVDSKLTASFDPKLHQATLDVLKGIQVTVI
jgi:nicotinamidase-related amidase